MMMRHKAITDTLTRGRVARWQTRFLTSLRKVPCVKSACASANVSRQTAYRTRATDATFAEAWRDALDASVDELEARAFKLALEGDSRLVEFMLKSHRPAVYRETTRTEIGIAAKIVLLPAKELRDA